MHRFFSRALAVLAGAACCLGAAAQAGSPASLPPTVQAALARAKLPQQAVAALVVGVDAAAPSLAWRAAEPMNPASVMKLVTTYAALDRLGPAFTWSTPVYLQGKLDAGTLHGNVYIQGQGDPKLVQERLWLLLRRLQGQGVQAIDGDIVLDHSAFAVAGHDPAAFDGEPLRAYNVAPDALLINYQALVMHFVPDPSAGVAHVRYEPPMAGVQLQPTVPLAPADAACGDWRAALGARLAQPGRTVFKGTYAAACGERAWPVAATDPAAFASRAVAGMWRDLGGRLSGQVRAGRVPAGLQPAFALDSPPLAEVVRDINKYSNNVMAQQVFLTLGLRLAGTGSFAGARQALGQWWAERLGGVPAPALDNGAGLSRDGRISAQALARLLQQAWASPVMPELLASLPIEGVDGTRRRSQGAAVGAAHLKTGSLRDVAAIAGFVHAADGRRYVLVAMVNHDNAAAARPALQALVDWVYALR